jgi:hypothetical protein
VSGEAGIRTQSFLSQSSELCFDFGQREYLPLGGTCHNESSQGISANLWTRNSMILERTWDLRVRSQVFQAQSCHCTYYMILWSSPLNFFFFWCYLTLGSKASHTTCLAPVSPGVKQASWFGFQRFKILAHCRPPQGLPQEGRKQHVGSTLGHLSFNQDSSISLWFIRLCFL